MASLPVRDPVADHLLTPQSAALLAIDSTINVASGRAEPTVPELAGNP